MSLVAAYFIANGIQKDVAAAKLERAGNLYQRPLEALLEHLSEHGRVTAETGFDSSAELVETEAVASAFRALDRSQAESGADLQVTPEGLKSRGRDHLAPSTLEAEWQSLQGSQRSLSAEARGAKHLHLIGDVRGLIGHIGDTSGLILDPDLDSYYLMDSTVVALPQTQDRLASMRASYRALADSKKIGPGERDEMAANSAMLKQSDVDHVAGDIETALKEDANFNGVSPTLKARLSPPYTSYLAANKVALDKLTSFSRTGDLDQLGSIDQSLAQAWRSSFDLWRTGSEELDALLQLRIADRHSSLWHGLAGMLGATLLPAIFAWVVLGRLRQDLLAVTTRLQESSRELVELGNTSLIASQGLACGASEQAASLEETSASSHEINSMTRSNAEQSRSAASQMATVDQQVTGLEQDLGKFTTRMAEISSSSERIATIIKVIHEISFQTNILALNAAVEAARAGEAGMGFAVVANEVRNLAQRCASAATDTERLIGENIARAHEGKAHLNQTFANLTTIVETARGATGLLSQIQQGSEEQVRGVEEISRALTQIEVVTQRTASAAEQGSRTSTELRRNAEDLNKVVTSLSSLVSRP